MTPVRIVGIGSPHGADIAGWRAVEALQRGGLAERFPTGLVSLENCAAPVHLYPLVAGCRLAVLIDATAGEACQPLDVEPAALRSATRRHSSHALGVAEMLELLHALSARPPWVLLLGLPIPNGESRSGAERRVQTMLPALGHRIEAAVHQWLGEAGAPAPLIS